ncbi:DUF3987 domain-containing protein [Mangrovibacterium sp.]|uniref:DUF3987 domain-containing protein n=1 Tax=Mangrovibacterium sp. TaxID=1961364 RepID=UPI00356A4431
MNSTTIYRNFNIPIEDKLLTAVLREIKNGKYQVEINRIRECVSAGQDTKADELKKALLAFTPSATFKAGRNQNTIKQYSGFVHLDFDKLDPDQIQSITEKIAAIPYSFACFRSPKGAGLKVFVKVSNDLNSHALAYANVKSYYEAQLAIEADPKCKDITRLCFVSFDPELYLNPNSSTFEITSTTQSETAYMTASYHNQTTRLDQIVAFTNQKETYINGSRNNYIYLFACNCNRSGIPQQATEAYVVANFQHENQAEILKSVDSAYRNNAADFATFANTAALQNPDTEEHPTENYLKATPLIPGNIYESLPDILKSGVLPFDGDLRKRDVFFTAAITILSGCLPNVTGIYAGERVYPHLFSFIIAPAASGKGVMKNAKRLADKYHDKLVAESKKAHEAYNQKLIEYKDTLAKRKKNDPIPPKPEEPKTRLLFIPADCSQAMLLQLLQDNNGQGIICETEADTMSGANKQDWGNYSPILRGAFHNEKISAARKTNRELIEINEPKLAVCLSGTPAQVPKLIGSAEDGLFSRFLFYAYKNEIVWQDPSPKPQGIVMNDHFAKLANDILTMIDFLEQSPTEISLTQQQWGTLNRTFSLRLREVTLYNNEEAASVVYRLGLMLYRMCMVLTALRKFENAENSRQMVCTDDDFNTALVITGIYLEHSLTMFCNLASQQEATVYKMPNNKKKFFENLPDEFQRKQALEIGKNFDMSERSIDEFLNNCIPTLLEKIKTGYYRKIKNYENNN